MGRWVERGRETGISFGKEHGRREGIAVGREMSVQEAIDAQPPPPAVRELLDTGIQTDGVALVPQSTSLSTRIPQELIDAIVSEVDDKDCLKACSVVSSSFRGASQRILLSSLTLNGHLDSTVCTLLAESPHIVAYIKYLKIKLPPSHHHNPSEIQSLQLVLAKLTAVQECIVTGVYPDARWADLNPKLSSALLDFITRQSLRSLRLSIIKDIPRTVFHHLIVSVPMLSFFQTYIEEAVDGSLADGPPPSSSIESLLLDPQSTSVSTLLTRPQFAAHTANLCRLSIVLGDGMSMIWATARTLQHIRLDCTRLNAAHLRFRRQFPALPALRSLEIVLHFSQQMAPCFIDIISRILASDAHSKPATINEIIVTFCPTPMSPEPDFSARVFTLPAALEKYLLSHPAVPRIRWRLQHHEESYTQFTGFVRAAMPKMHVRGKVAFEQFKPTWNGLISKYFWT
ncbi:hypothetical protein FB451DRAFT_458062 [Mycena latifolia]|nr:hypothetical protein FB451DRAFT_458062 [Mycena latifolia]